MWFVRVLCDILQRIQCSIYYYYYFNKDVLVGVTNNNNKIYRVDLELAASILKDQPEYISNVFPSFFRILEAKKRAILSSVCCSQLFLFEVSLCFVLSALLHILIHVSGSVYIPYISSVNTTQHFASQQKMTRIVIKQIQMNK